MSSLTRRGAAALWDGPRHPTPSPPGRRFVQSVQPIVLVGGRSRRFGRDKLRLRWDRGLLVDRPIAALRAVFGSRVALAGACHPAVRAHGDGVIEDQSPGAGPIGGVFSALCLTRSPVFVVAGDMPGVTPAIVRSILAAAEVHRRAWVCVAWHRRAHPCLGLYRPAVVPVLAAHLRRGVRSLTAVLAALSSASAKSRASKVVMVRCSAQVVANINTPSDARVVRRRLCPRARSTGCRSAAP